MLAGFYIFDGNMTSFSNWKREQEEACNCSLHHVAVLGHNMNDETIFAVSDKRLTPIQAGKMWSTMWNSVPEEPDELHDEVEVAVNDSYMRNVSPWKFDNVVLLAR